MAFSLCGILEFHPVLRQKQCLTAFIQAQESLSGASCFPIGNLFTVNCITYSHCGDGGVSKPNQTSHDVGCEHGRCRTQVLLTPRVSGSSNPPGYYIGSISGFQPTEIHGIHVSIMRISWGEGRFFLTITDHREAYLFLSSSWTHGYIILRLIIQLWTLLATDFSWFPLWLPAL